MKISLLTPTRGRPQFMHRLWDSALTMAENPENIEIVFYIDYDDATSFRMCYQLNAWLSSHVEMVLGPRIILSQMWNECWKAANGDILHHCADDVVFRTKDWDSIIINEFEKVPDKILFIYGRDGITPVELQLGTHGFIHQNWAKTIDYFVPPYFAYGKNDAWLSEVAVRIDRCKYMPELYIEHMHPAVGKAPMDSTYKDAIQRGGKNHRKIYDDMLPKRKADAEKLKQFINEFEKNDDI